MSNEVKVIPTPIQRNLNDVAVELTKLYFDGQNSGATIEQIQDTYKKFYASARNASGMSLEKSEEILEK